MMNKEEASSKSIVGSDESDIRHGIGAMQTCAHALAVEKGWYQPAKSTLEAIALMHSELSEALEECRDGKPYIYEGEDGKPEGLGIEYADCIIRIMDDCENKGVNLADCILCKHAYNQTRPHRHGRKVL